MTFQRPDGRAVDQIRTTKITPNISPYAEGSALIEVGRTKVICTATVEDRVPMFMRNKGIGWVTAEYAMLPRATNTRTQRETQRPSGRTQEIQRLIGRSLRAVIDTKLMGERQIMLDCDVIQADGGTRCASITGAYVALALALKPIFTKNTWPLTGLVAATSVGIVHGMPMLDLAYDEDSQAHTDMNVFMTDAGKFVEIQGTAEAEPFDRAELDRMLALAEDGIRTLFAAQRTVLDAAGVP